MQEFAKFVTVGVHVRMFRYQPERLKSGSRCYRVLVVDEAGKTVHFMIAHQLGAWHIVDALNVPAWIRTLKGKLVEALPNNAIGAHSMAGR